MEVAVLRRRRRTRIVVVVGWLGGLVAAPIVLVFGPRRVREEEVDVLAHTLVIFSSFPSLPGLT